VASFRDLTPGTWTIDTAHSQVGFVARHLMIAKVRGHFSSFSGTISVPENPLDATVTASIDLASVTTGDPKRDEHLRTADFFDAEQYPTMSFVSTGVKDEGGELTLFGDLTIRDVTRPVELQLEFEGVSKDPWGGTRAAFSATADVSRKDWGLEWNVPLESGGFLVGDKVKLELEIEAVKS